MKTIFTSLYNINDISQWSGTIHFMSKNLEESGIDLLDTSDFIIPHESFYRAKSYLLKRFLNLLYFKEREPRILKEYAKYFHSKFSVDDYDNILSPQTAELAYIETRKPMAFWVDATFNLIAEQLQGREKFFGPAIEYGHKYDRLVYEKSSAAIFASKWAADDAINTYGINPEKVHVVPFGANINDKPNSEIVHKQVIRRDNKILKFLFIAVNWEQKGGDKVVEILNKLNDYGINTHFDIVGGKPKALNLHADKFTWHGFLNKNNPEQYQKLIKLLSENHYLMMFPRQEAYGLVYCEANAYGLPVITHSIGGISTIIKHQTNGLLFKREDSISKIIKEIIDINENINSYNELAYNAYNEFITRLNWRTSCETVKKILTSLKK